MAGLILFMKKNRQLAAGWKGNMQIELLIDGEKKTFTAPFTPLLARRKYFEIMARSEQRKEQPTFEEQLREDDEIYSILSDIVFKGQFTLEQLYEGASQEYIFEKLTEAIYGIKPKNKKEENDKKK